jgi:hypothetical protein
MQEWPNLARDHVSRLRLTPPSVNFLVGLSVTKYIYSVCGNCNACRNAGKPTAHAFVYLQRAEIYTTAIILGTKLTYLVRPIIKLAVNINHYFYSVL